MQIFNVIIYLMISSIMY